MINGIKYFICPMSKNIVDTILELNSQHIGLLPSRRQIEYDGGYVNNWTTKTFVDYVNNKSNIIIERDHGGIGQNDSDEYESFKTDSLMVDIVHIDPWKHYKEMDDGISETIKNIKFLHSLNQQLKYEIGTEESIRRFNEDELIELIENLKLHLTDDEFNNVHYVTIQSGVGLDLVKRRNIGEFDIERLKTMIDVCKKYGKLTKEHNGDYLSDNDIKIRFNEGLDSINIGPEIVQIETETILNNMDEKDINNFYDVCLSSDKWKKWVSDDFNLSDKRSLIMVCGHYNFEKLNEIFNINENIQKEIKKNLRNKIQSLLNII